MKMATKLTKTVKRQIVMKNVNGVEGDVDVTMSPNGIVFSKGRRKLPEISWDEIGKLATLPDNIPAKFTGDKMAWLIELSMNKETKPAKAEVAE